MQSQEIFRLLTWRIRRGLVIWPMLWAASSVCFGLALMVAKYHPWSPAAFLAGILCFLADAHVRKRYVMARLVSENPQLVYWGHPNDLRQHFSRDAIIDFEFLKLHLRNGQQFEVGLRPAEMRNFIDWLAQQNPSMRWGPYDNSDSPIEITV